MSRFMEDDIVTVTWGVITDAHGRPCINCNIIADLETERERQEALHPKATPMWPGTSDLKLMSLLMEELGEAATALNDGDVDHMLTELTQVAALIVARLEKHYK